MGMGKIISEVSSTLDSKFWIFYLTRKDIYIFKYIQTG